MIRFFRRFKKLTLLALVSFFVIILNRIEWKAPTLSQEYVCNCPPISYDECNIGKPEFINVHIIPHSHQDPGWIKTVDEYYVEQVDKILNNVIYELGRNEQRRFIFAEIALFWMWWQRQSAAMKSRVRKLVVDLRIEFVGAGWTINDEATTYYRDIIDQQTLGLQFLAKEFGKCGSRPRIAWQLDTFGHSRTQADLLAQFGFDGLVIGRVDYQDLSWRVQTKAREFLWRPSTQNEIFTHILSDGYWSSENLCFDEVCVWRKQSMKEPSLLEKYLFKAKNRFKEHVKEFIDVVRKRIVEYKTSHLMMLVGGDFAFKEAAYHFEHLELLLNYVNKMQNETRINVFYSTPSCYLKALCNHNFNATLPVKTPNDDFFPYAHRPHAYWTGYFTSRSALKYYVRTSGTLLQAMRHLFAFADLTLSKESREALLALERAVALAQHHDALTGTEAQHVANDYARQLASATEQCVHSVMAKSLQKLLSSNNARFHHCPLLNVSECLPIESQEAFSVVVYSTQSKPRDYWLRIPTVTDDYEVVGDTQVDFVPIDEELTKIPERTSKAKYTMVFRVNLPALGLKVIKIARKKAKRRSLFHQEFFNKTMENTYLMIEFDSNANLMRLKNKLSKLETNLTQNFCYYRSKESSNNNSQLAGSYVCRPETRHCYSVRKHIFIATKQVQELRQVYNEWISQTVRLFADSSHVEFEWQIGPIDVDSGGKDVFVRFQSDLVDSNGTFFTDSNGHETIIRQRKSNLTENISGNYYPVNSWILIKDKHRQLALVNDRAQGGSSLHDGSIELALHRRILTRDDLGLDEALNELGSDKKGLVVRGKLFLLLEEAQSEQYREKAHDVNWVALIGFSLSLLFETNKWSALAVVDNDVQLLTLMNDKEYSSHDTLIIRLEGNGNSKTRVNLKSLFRETVFNLTAAEELSLGANMKQSELLQMNRVNCFKSSEKHSDNEGNKLNSFEYHLQPRQIRTFRIWYKK